MKKALNSEALLAIPFGVAYGIVKSLALRVPFKPWSQGGLTRRLHQSGAIAEELQLSAKRQLHRSAGPWRLVRQRSV